LQVSGRGTHMPRHEHPLHRSAHRHPRSRPGGLRPGPRSGPLELRLLAAPVVHLVRVHGRAAHTRARCSSCHRGRGCSDMPDQVHAHQAVIALEA
jgi:hypothetical protein